MEKEIASHSSTLAWRVPWTEEPGRLQSMGSQRVRHNWMTNTFTFSLHRVKTCWGQREYGMGSEKIIKNTSYNHVTSYRTRAITVMSISSFCNEYVCVIFLFSLIPLSCNTGIPNLWDLMPDDLRWSWCNNNRNKVHNKCNALESSRNHLPPPWSVEKLSSLKLIPGAKNVGDHSSRASFAPWYFSLLSTK